MTCPIYIISGYENGYAQYPDGSVSSVFGRMWQYCEAATQLVVHRESDIMYYCYFRKGQNGRYFGVSIVLNGQMFIDFGRLFKLFEMTVDKVVKEGVFLHYSDYGQVNIQGTPLTKEESELKALCEYVNSELDAMARTIASLPPSDYSVAKDSLKKHSFKDDIFLILKSSHTYGYTCIYKDQDFDTVRMTRYSAVLSRLKKENKRMEKENEALKQENERILKKKKQYNNVIWLLIALATALIVISIAISAARQRGDALAKTISELSDVQKNYELQTFQSDIRSDTIEALRGRERKLKDNLEYSRINEQSLHGRLESLEKELSEISNELESSRKHLRRKTEELAKQEQQLQNAEKQNSKLINELKQTSATQHVNSIRNFDFSSTTELTMNVGEAVQLVFGRQSDAIPIKLCKVEDRKSKAIAVSTTGCLIGIKPDTNFIWAYPAGKGAVLVKVIIR